MDKLSLGQRSRNMAAIRSKNTKPEIVVRQLLFGMGLRYRLHDKRLPGTPDIVLRRYNSVVFVHGCFWHHHESCSRSFIPKSNKNYWLPKIIGNVKRDKENDTKLRKLGWNVVIVWECQVKKTNRLATRFSTIFNKQRKPQAILLR
jgi:DNA mismatch endonuclease (patch repair protein)